MQGSLNSTVVWFPLVDVNKDLGALEVIPKSHRWGLLESEQNDWYREIKGLEDDKYVSVEVEAGDVLFFSSFLVHRSGNNVTDKIRWSCHFKYNDLDEQTFIEKGHPHIPGTNGNSRAQTVTLNPTFGIAKHQPSYSLNKLLNPRARTPHSTRLLD